jgi:hypothetical protein
MDLIKHSTSVAQRPIPSQTGTPGWANSATHITADMINGILAELKHTIEAAGLDLDINDDTLLKQAIILLAKIPGITYTAANGGTITIDAEKFVAGISQVSNLTATNITSATTRAGTLYSNTSVINPPTGNPYLIVGRVDNSATDSTPFIDFRPQNQGSFTDVRLLASGGILGQNYQGTLTVLADKIQQFSDGTYKSMDAFPAGTKLIFWQSAAPPGWTNVGWGPNYTLVTAGATGGGTAGGGGGKNHNIVTGCNAVYPHTHSVDPVSFNTTAASANHTHRYMDRYYAESGNIGTGPWTPIPVGSGSNSTDQDNDTARYIMDYTDPAGADHVHGVNVPATNTTYNTGYDTWQPTFVTVICCSKN